MINNAATHHFQVLVHHTMALLQKLEKQQQPPQQAVNAVYFLRIIVKHLTENLSAAQLVTYVNGPAQANGSASAHAGAASEGAHLFLSAFRHADEGLTGIISQTQSTGLTKTPAVQRVCCRGL